MHHNAYQTKLSVLRNRVESLLKRMGGLPVIESTEVKNTSIPESPKKDYTVNSRGYVGTSRRLTDKEKEQALDMWDNGYTVQSIATGLKTSRPTIYSILHRERPEDFKTNESYIEGGSRANA